MENVKRETQGTRERGFWLNLPNRILAEDRPCVCVCVYVCVCVWAGRGESLITWGWQKMRSMITY
jgi:hypothetical protein